VRRLFKLSGAGAYVLALLCLSGFVPAAAQLPVGTPALLHRQVAPKLTPDGRFAYAGTPEGWLTRYDTSTLAVLARVRTGAEMPRLAISGDGRWILVAGTEPDTLTLFDTNLQAVRTYPLFTQDGKLASRVAGVFEAAPRQSFVVALQDIAELWEISYDPKAEPIYEGLVHDYRMGEGLAAPGFLGIRRTPLEQPLDMFYLDGPRRHILGATGPQGARATDVQVINLDVRRRIASFSLPDAPALDSSFSFTRNGKELLAIPHAQDGCVTLVDISTWKVVRPATAPESPLSGKACETAPAGYRTP
jgi:hypothetical protein